MMIPGCDSAHPGADLEENFFLQMAQLERTAASSRRGSRQRLGARSPPSPGFLQAQLL